MYDNFDFEDSMLAAWRSSAACRGMTDIFWPPPFGTVEIPSSRAFRIERCRAVCMQCPVFDDCQQWIIENPGEGIDMVVAGFTYEERRNIGHGR